MIKKLLTRFLKPVDWMNLRRTSPVSAVFGLDRGTPIDRFYIEKFLSANSNLIRGSVLEVGENTYTMKFGTGVKESLIFDYDKAGSAGNGKIAGDLSNPQTLPAGVVDCFICTQTFNFIYDFKAAITGAKQLLREDGVMLVSLAGLCQISRYDMDRWGDYWRFTTASVNNVFAEVFGAGKIEVECHGNVLAAVSLLHGISVEELTPQELEVKDPNYQVIITVIARNEKHL